MITYICEIPDEKVRFDFFNDWPTKKDIEPYIICIIEGKIEFELFRINEKLYAPQISFHTENKIHMVMCVKEFSFKKNISKYNSSEVGAKCPYCGYTIMDSWELQDYVDDLECEQCGSIFNMEKHISVKYHTIPVNKNKNIKELTNE